MESESKKRSWWRWHGFTWGMILLLGCSLIVKNLLGEFEYRGWAVRHHGFPLTYMTSNIYDSGSVAHRLAAIFSKQTKIQSFHPFNLVADITIAGLLLLSTAFALELWMRPRGKPFQFCLKVMFGLTVLSAIFFGLLKAGFAGWEDLIWGPIVVGICCAVFVMGWLVRLGNDRYYRRELH